MNADRILQKFEATHGTWRVMLDPLGDAGFVRAPADGGWSAAQICCHVGDVSDMLLGAAELCAQGDGEEKGFQFQPWMITVAGSLPPTRIRVPDLPEELQHLGRPEPTAKVDALARLDGMVEHMHAMRDLVAGASRRMRRRHPVGGWLHAQQWYHLNEMHLRHHLRQLRRLLG